MADDEVRPAGTSSTKTPVVAGAKTPAGSKTPAKAPSGKKTPVPAERPKDEAAIKAEEAKKVKQVEIERMPAEVRKRMEEASRAKKAKKGFMTQERKKKLRLLLRKKAVEEWKKEQERKADERRRIIEERCGRPKDIGSASEDEIKSVLQAYEERINNLEGLKYDFEYVAKRKDVEISDVKAQVNDLRNKFVRPIPIRFKRKYENKFAKFQKNSAKFNFRNQLKVVKKKEFTLEEEKKEKKPDWSKRKPGDAKVKEEAEGVEAQANQK